MPTTPVKPGTGPRHGAFHPQSTLNNTIYYLVTEMGNTISSYKVKYMPDDAGLGFSLANEASTLGKNVTADSQSLNKAAEVSVAPNGKSLLVSNRNFTGFFPHIANPDLQNSTTIPSDSLASFSLDGIGGMKFNSLYSSGGSFPRGMQQSRCGKYVAVTNQMNFRVVILEKDQETGKVNSKPIAWLEGLGNVTSAVWAD